MYVYVFKSHLYFKSVSMKYIMTPFFIGNTVDDYVNNKAVENTWE